MLEEGPAERKQVDSGTLSKLQISKKQNKKKPPKKNNSIMKIKRTRLVTELEKNPLRINEF